MPKARAASLVLMLAASTAVVASPAPRCLSFDERVDAELALERVYDAHRTWPGANPGRKPTFEARVARADVAAKVERELRRSAPLGLTADDLQREVERMARASRDAALLGELFAALHDDPFLVAECLGRRIAAARRLAGRQADGGGALPPDWRAPIIDATRLHAVVIRSGGSADLHDDPPDGRFDHTAVWTGAEMIVWGGEYIPWNTGGRYDPATDSWRPTSVEGAVPVPRSRHTAVWTGSEMIVWGGLIDGGGRTSTGGRYDPASDTWRALALPSAPIPRSGHVAVWTGSEMIVWGGSGTASAYLNDGGRYDPVSDGWTATSLGANVPQGRIGATAIWTGARMVVWGGLGGSTAFQTGGLYDPATDSWQPTSLSNAPAGRVEHTAVWTGTRMIVWGGSGASLLRDGGVYDPVADTWTPTTLTGAPQARKWHTAVWTGTEMIVWGGQAGSQIATGGRYDPAADTWRATSLAGAPQARDWHTAVWTGREMIVWGGYAGYPDYSLNTGGRYDPATDGWRPTWQGTAPSARSRHSAVWTGVEMIVWGGTPAYAGCCYLRDGARYYPALDAWLPTSVTTATPTGRQYHGAVWTGTEMIVWGGDDNLLLATGARYDPVTDGWIAMATSGAPAARTQHSAVWSGREMIVWGGRSADSQRGGRYDPAADRWTSMSIAGAPIGRTHHSSVWTGSELIVWGGDIGTVPVNSGGRYHPATDAWSATTLTAAPAARADHTAVWTGTEMIVWGGAPFGGRYRPSSNSWTPVAAAGEPANRASHTAVWTGREMIVWGGVGTAYFNSGGRYDPASDGWRPTSTATGVPSPRAGHTAVFTGRSMIVWGGELMSGGVYDPAIDSWLRTPPGGSLIVAKGAGNGAAYDATIAAGSFSTFDAFPGLGGFGANPAAGDAGGGRPDEILAAPGPGPSLPSRVRGFDPGGVPLAGLDFAAYGTGGFGARVAAGGIDAGVAILTGPGPSPVFGPHVRAFRYTGFNVTALAKVTFFAYGTLRYGAHVACADVDGDGFDEIVTGPGPGAVFGPHVRGFDYDGAVVVPIAGIGFFAYGTLRYVVEVAGGDVDGDGYGEIVTGPGPSASFLAHLRGFDVDGGVVKAMASVNAVVLPGARYGLSVAAGDLDRDGVDEIACGAGPDPAFNSSVAAFDAGRGTLVPMPGMARDPFGLSYGARVAVGQLSP